MYLLLQVDPENNADQWWAACDAAYPAIAKALRHDDKVIVPNSVSRCLADLPGYDTGPEYAAFPVFQIGVIRSLEEAVDVAQRERCCVVE